MASRCILALFLSYLASRALASGDATIMDFKVRQANGLALFWDPVIPGWRKMVKGQAIVRGTMVQIQAGGAATIDAHARGGAEDQPAEGQDTRLILKQPMIFRLDQDAFRKIDLETTVLDAPPSDEKKGELTSEIFHDVAEAWEQTAALLFNDSRFKSAKEEGDTSNNDQGPSVGKRAKRIELVFPKDGEFVLTNRFPSAVRATWHVEGKIQPKEFIIYMWKTDKSRGAPVARASGSGADLPITSEGNYFVQVTSSDGSAQSAPARLEVSRPLAPSMANVAPKKGGTGVFELKLNLPRDGMTKTSKSKQETMTFAWSPCEVERGCSYILRLTDLTPGGSGETEVKTSDTVTTAALNCPFDGAWSVEAYRQAAAVSGKPVSPQLFQRSEARRLFCTSEGGAKLFARALKAKESRIIFLDTLSPPP